MLPTRVGLEEVLVAGTYVEHALFGAAFFAEVGGWCASEPVGFVDAGQLIRRGLRRDRDPIGDELLRIDEPVIAVCIGRTRGGRCSMTVFRKICIDIGTRPLENMGNESILVSV